jgi:hypothetical protein
MSCYRRVVRCPAGQYDHHRSAAANIITRDFFFTMQVYPPIRDSEHLLLHQSHNWHPSNKGAVALMLLFLSYTSTTFGGGSRG